MINSKKFLKQPSGNIALKFLILLFLIGIFSSLLSNNRPIILRFMDKTYYPILNHYPPSEFTHEDSGLIFFDYKTISDYKGYQWSVWPPIRWGQHEINTDRPYFPAPPSKSNLLGTDNQGRDVLTLLLHGTKTGLVYALGTWLISTFFGVAFGLMGLFGGRVDFWGQRLLEVAKAIPHFFVLLTLSFFIGPSLFGLILISSSMQWMQSCSLTRVECLKIKRRQFIEAATAIGIGKFSLIKNHILPHSLGPILSSAPFQISYHLIVLSGLSYLGIGPSSDYTSWGELLAQGQEYLGLAWWLPLFPSLLLFLVIFLLTLIGNAIRRSLDPHLMMTDS